MNNLIDMNTPRFLSVKDTARKYGVSQYWIRNGLKDGTIAHMMSGKKALIDTVKLERIFEDVTESSVSK